MRLLETQHKRRRLEHRLIVLAFCFAALAEKRAASKQAKKDARLRAKFTKRFAPSVDALGQSMIESTLYDVRGVTC